jgi:hypothetical protein
MESDPGDIHTRIWKRYPVCVVQAISWYRKLFSVSLTFSGGGEQPCFETGHCFLLPNLYLLTIHDRLSISFYDNEPFMYVSITLCKGVHSCRICFGYCMCLLN